MAESPHYAELTRHVVPIVSWSERVEAFEGLPAVQLDAAARPDLVDLRRVIERESACPAGATPLIMIAEQEDPRVPTMAGCWLLGHDDEQEWALFDATVTRPVKCPLVLRFVNSQHRPLLEAMAREQILALTLDPLDDDAPKPTALVVLLVPLTGLGHFLVLAGRGADAA